MDTNKKVMAVGCNTATLLICQIHSIYLHKLYQDTDLVHRVGIHLFITKTDK